MDRPELIKSRAGHGGDIYSDPSGTWLDLSANINPKPFPAEVYQALPRILDQARAYPDIEYEDLREALANYAGKLSHTEISPDWIIPGNGAVEILDKAIARANGVLIIRPCFSEYELSCIRHNIPYDTLDRDPDLKVEMGEELFSRIREKLNVPFVAKPGTSLKGSDVSMIDTLILCNPNNPDGKKYEKKALEQFLTTYEAAGIRVIVDETFGEYLEDADMLLPLVANHQNLLIVKALTKFFGLPGVRLGYGITKGPAWQQAITAGLTTWNVGTFAQELARLLMKNDEFIKTSRRDNQTNRGYLKAGLEASPLFETVYPSAASFLMVYSKRLPELLLRLREQRILIRELARMPGLGIGYARVAVKSKADIDQLLAALQKIELELSQPE